MKRLFPFLLFFSILFSACSVFDKKMYVIGIDPTFAPVKVAGQGDQVFGFSVDLLNAIAKVEKIKLRYEQSGTENLFTSLQNGQFQGVLSSLYPQNYESEIYSISKNYFFTGPVLVVLESSNLTHLSQFDSKIVGVLANSDAYYIVQKYPNIVLSTYSSVPILLETLSYGDIDGVVVSLLDAQAYVRNLYTKVLKVSSPPLNNEGLRMITVEGQNEELVKKFNKGLKTCIDRGIYNNLLIKWQLTQSCEKEAQS